MELLKKINSEINDTEAAKQFDKAGNEILKAEEEINSVV